MLRPSPNMNSDIALPGLEARPRKSFRDRLLSTSQPIEVVVFLVLLAIFAALVIPPIVSLIRTAVSHSATGEFTLDNFVSILPALIRADLLANTLIFAGATTLISFVFGSLLAWFAERTDAPFRRLLYVSAFLSFALPTVIQVLGWIFLLGRRQGLDQRRSRQQARHPVAAVRCTEHGRHDLGRIRSSGPRSYFS